MIPFTRQPLSTIEPIAPQNLASGGAVVNAVPVWNGVQYVPDNPISWQQNGVFQGRVNLINITGNATSSVFGGVATLNIAGASGGVTSFNTATGAINLVNGTNTTVVALGGGAFRVDATGGTMSFFRAEQVNSVGAVLYTNNIQQNFHLQFEAGNNVTLSPTTQVNGTRIRIDASTGTAYTHPTYIPLTLTPSIVGNTLNTHTIITDNIGSVVNAIPIAIPLPTTSQTTLTHSGLGTASFTGTAPNYTIKGFRTLTPTTLAITDTGSSLDFAVNGAVTINNTGVGSGIVIAPGTASSFTMKGFLGSGSVTVQDFGTYIQINGAGSSGLVGNNGNGLSVTANTVTMSLATTGNAGAMPALSGTTTTFLRGDGQWANVATGGIAGISVNGAGTYTNINFGAGLSVIGNNITAVSSGHTINNSASGIGIVQTAGFATSHTLKGLIQGANVSITDNGTSITIASTGGGGFPLEVRKDGVTINPSTAILNFKGAGVSVVNGVGVEVTIPGGGGGLAGISVNGIGTYTNLNFLGAGVAVSGNNITISGGGGGGGVTSVNTNPPITNLGTPTAPIIGLAPTGITPGLYGNANAIPVLTLDTWGRVTNIGTVPPAGGGGGVTSFNAATGAITLQNGTNTTVVALGGGAFRIDATAGAGGITSVVSNNPSLTASITGSQLNLDTTGITQSIPNSYNPTTRLLTVTEYITQKGIVTGIVTKGFTMPQGLPNGVNGDILYHNGTTWTNMDVVVHDNTQNSIRHRFGAVNSGVIFFPSTTLIQNDNAAIQGLVTAFVKAPNVGIELSNTASGNVYINAGSGAREAGSELVAGSISVGNAAVKIGFFGKLPIVKPNVTTGNLASLQTALQQLGLINLV